MRDHDGQPIEVFNGLFQRGDPENTPIDHFQGSNNLAHKGKSVLTRDGISVSQDVEAQVPLQNIKRIYNYPTLTKNTLLILSYNTNTDEGNIYHVIDSVTQYGPVLTVEGMTDFAFVPFAGRAYISPFTSIEPGYPAPAIGLSTESHSGTGIEAGVHKYAVTFFNSDGETTGSPITTVTAHAALSNPSIAPTVTDLAPGFTTVIKLTSGQVYKWKFTWTPDGNATETNVSPESLGFTNTAGQHGLLFGTTQTIPTGATLNIYRTTGNGSTFYREFDSLTQANITAGVMLGSTLTDAEIVSNQQAPSSNNTSALQFTLNDIPLAVDSAVTITGRKIYRTEAGEDQLKLLTTINDNTTETFVDSIPDASLGAAIPVDNTLAIPGENIEKGLAGEFLYVYAGDGTNARKAAGESIGSGMTVAAGAAGHTDAGLHIYGVVSETVSGYLSPPGSLTTFTNISTNSVSFGNIPTSGDSNVTKRHIVASKKITGYNGDTEGYDLFFIPNATINNNTDTFLNNISFFDQDLLEDASYLFDNYEEIPAGAFLTEYQGRLVLGATYDDQNLVLVSAKGEPEAINQITGILATQPNGFPVSNAAEFRDVLYVFRPNSAMAFTDNGDEPSAWPLINVDAALGARPHAIAQFLNSATQSVDYLVIATYQGISLFTGGFQVPELSWKIENLWKSYDRNDFGRIQIVINTVKKRIYVIVPDRYLLVGFFQHGLNPKSIQWEPWTFTQPVNTIAVTNIDEDIIGSDIY